jgi:hypothetical protein
MVASAEVICPSLLASRGSLDPYTGVPIDSVIKSTSF